jgi:hypothetical protein
MFCLEVFLFDFRRTEKNDLKLVIWWMYSVCAPLSDDKNDGYYDTSDHTMRIP